MTKTLTWMGFAVLLGACAGGDDDDGRNDSAGDLGGNDSSSSAGDTTMSTSMTTAPTTAETLSTTVDPDTGDSGDSADSGDSGSTGDVEALSCDNYCAVYDSSCADHTEYANTQDCLDNCAQWPLGAETDTAGDTLGCRIYHATVAGTTDAAEHCPHAGPSGAGMCVAEEAPSCDVYCTSYFANCTMELNVFEDEADCTAQCSTWYQGTDADIDGHTVGCHAYHADAAMGDAETHCPHASPSGGGVCVL